MATKTLRRASFIAALVAPLPADAEPVDSDGFRALLRADARATDKAVYDRMKDTWDRASYAFKLAKHDQGAAFYRWILAGRDPATDPVWHHAPIVKAAERRIMLTPAPGRTQLTWKRKTARWYERDAEALAAIAADEARLSSKREG